MIIEPPQILCIDPKYRVDCYPDPGKEIFHINIQNLRIQKFSIGQALIFTFIFPHV